MDYENKRLYTLKVEGSNPHIDPQFLAWGPYKDEATIKVHMLNKARTLCIYARQPVFVHGGTSDRLCLPEVSVSG